MYQNTAAIADSSTQRYHAENYGQLSYDAFVAQFRDETIPLWNPAPWADLFVRAGARYVVLTTKTEDGFLLWPSDHPNGHRSHWQSQRDVVGEFASAMRARGLRFGAYYCSGIDWTFGGLPIIDAETLLAAMPQSVDYITYVDSHWRELINRYAPSLLWNDYGYPATADPSSLLEFYFEHVPDGVVNDRFDTAVLREALENRGRPTTPRHRLDGRVYSDFATVEYSTAGPADRKWEACRGIGTSFGYNRQESDRSYISARELIHLFVDVVARGGNLLLNVGPTATGEIPWVQAERLLELGWWLYTNGEAIYGTHRWEIPIGITVDGLPVRYTASDDAVYAIVLGSPPTDAVELDVRLDEGAHASLVATRRSLVWAPSRAGVTVDLPERPDDRPAYCIRFAPASAVHRFLEV